MDTKTLSLDYDNVKEIFWNEEEELEESMI